MWSIRQSSLRKWLVKSFRLSIILRSQWISRSFSLSHKSTHSPVSLEKLPPSSFLAVINHPHRETRSLMGAPFTMALSMNSWVTHWGHPSLWHCRWTHQLLGAPFTMALSMNSPVTGGTLHYGTVDELISYWGHPSLWHCRWTHELHTGGTLHYGTVNELISYWGNPSLWHCQWTHQLLGAPFCMALSMNSSVTRGTLLYGTVNELISY